MYVICTFLQNLNWGVKVHIMIKNSEPTFESYFSHWRFWSVCFVSSKAIHVCYPVSRCIELLAYSPYVFGANLVSITLGMCLIWLICEFQGLWDLTSKAIHICYPVSRCIELLAYSPYVFGANLVSITLGMRWYDWSPSLKVFGTWHKYCIL